MAQEEKYVYHCDICGEEKDWDTEIHWLTPAYGLCDKCYQSLTEEEKALVMEYDGVLDRLPKELKKKLNIP